MVFKHFMDNSLYGLKFVKSLYIGTYVHTWLFFQWHHNKAGTSASLFRHPKSLGVGERDDPRLDLSQGG